MLRLEWDGFFTKMPELQCWKPGKIIMVVSSSHLKLVLVAGSEIRMKNFTNQMRFWSSSSTALWAWTSKQTVPQQQFCLDPGDLVMQEKWRHLDKALLQGWIQKDVNHHHDHHYHHHHPHHHHHRQHHCHHYHHHKYHHPHLYHHHHHHHHCHHHHHHCHHHINFVIIIPSSSSPLPSLLSPDHHHQYNYCGLKIKIPSSKDVHML